MLFWKDSSQWGSVQVFIVLLVNGGGRFKKA